MQVELFGQCPLNEKMDAALSNLKACKHLSLSTNNIGKITSLAGMENLEILSVGRNQLRSLDVDGVSDTLQEIWASYNLVGSLAGVEKLLKLKTLFVSNNNIKSIDEVNRLVLTSPASWPRTRLQTFVLWPLLASSQPS